MFDSPFCNLELVSMILIKRLFRFIHSLFQDDVFPTLIYPLTDFQNNWNEANVYELYAIWILKLSLAIC